MAKIGVELPQPPAQDGGRTFSHPTFEPPPGGGGGGGWRGGRPNVQSSVSIGGGSLVSGGSFFATPGVLDARFFATDTPTGLCTAIRAILAQYPAGGISIDARGFLTAQTFDADLVVNVPEISILFPQVAVAMGAFSLRVTAGMHGVRLVWPKGWSVYTLGTGLFVKPRWTYTGNGIALRVGDGTADTHAFIGENFGVDLEAAGAAAVGIELDRVINYELIRPLVHDYQGAGADTKTGLYLNGTGQFTGWGTIYQPILNRLNPALKMRTANANIVLGGEIRGSVASGSNGIDIDAAEENRIFGTDFDSLVAGIHFGGTALFNSVYMRTEQNSTADVVLDVGARANEIESNKALIVVDNGNFNRVKGARSVSTPAALAVGNNNDYALTDRLSWRSTLRLTGDAGNSVLTGIAGGAEGRTIRIVHVGGGTVTIAHQNAGSAAANRFLHPAAASPVMALDDVVEVEYDRTTQRWRVCSVLQ